MNGGGCEVYIAARMRARDRRRGRLRIASGSVLATCAACMLVVPGALAAPEYATPDPDSPAGEEYALPVDQARADAVGDSRRRGTPGAAAAADSGTRTAAPLFGVGIVRPQRGGESRSPREGQATNPAKRRSGTVDGAKPLVQRTSTDGQVALIVFFVLLGAGTFACLIRFAARRSVRGDTD